MFDADTIAIITAVFLVAGTVKGVVGLGMPIVSLALLTIAFGLPEAMALMLVPSLATNLWQAAIGGHGLAILRRIWPFLLMATATVWLGAGALRRVDLAWLSTLLGMLLVAYAGLGLSGRHFTLTPRRERWAAPLLGAVNGILTGMTGAFAVPGVMYLQAIGLGRDTLIQAMGILFTASTLILAAALGGNGLLSATTGTLSAAAVLPAIVGMVLGQRIRKRLPEERFRAVLYAALLVLGGYIMARALIGG